MCTIGELRTHRRLLGGMAGQLASEILQARCNGAQILLVGGDRAVRSRCWLGVACGLGLLLLDSS
jgi:hypothetical protein